MTREEAIRELKIQFVGEYDRQREAKDMAIKALEQEPCDDTVSHGVFNQVMWERDTAIEQLRKLGYELGQKIEPCDDAVSRQAVIAEMRNLYPDIPFVDFNNARLKWTRKYKPYLDCEEVVKSMPSVLPKREKGEWIDDTRLGYHVSVCSNCNWRGHGDTCLIYKAKYCPNCGAKMESEETDAER